MRSRSTISVAAGVALSLIGSCGDTGVYELSLEIGHSTIYVEGRSAGDACCGFLFPSATEQCGFVGDVPECAPCGCVESLAILRDGAEIAHSDPYRRRMTAVRAEHAASGGEVLEVVVHGCHGTARFDVVVPPSREDAEVEATVELESVTFEWISDGSGTKTCGVARDLTTWWCCGPDSGSLTVAASTGPFTTFSFGRLWALEVEVEGAEVTAWEALWASVSPD